jgi:hypothetical protein
MTAVLLFLRGAWGWVKAVPWWVWVIAAVVFLWQVDRDMQYRKGVAFERDRWETAQRAADAAAAAVAAQRAETAQTIATETAADAAKATTETRTQTAVAVERVNHAMRSAPAPPAGCPEPGLLPDIVQYEGRQAVERARAAAGGVRARPNP